MSGITLRLKYPVRLERVEVLDADTCDFCREVSGKVVEATGLRDADKVLDVLPPAGCEHAADAEDPRGCRGLIKVSELKDRSSDDERVME